MNKHQIRDIKSDIHHTRLENIEETYQMAKYCLSSYFYSGRTFGYNSDVTKGVKRTWKTYLDVISEEKYLMHLIVRHGRKLDVGETWALLDDLDYANDQTITYLYSYLDNVDDACDAQAAWRAVWEKRSFEMLTETYDYRHRLCSLLLTFDDIKSFLDFPKEFWNFIEPRIDMKTDFDLPFEDAKSEYGLKKYLDGFGNVFNFRVTLPIITNLAKASFTVHSLQEAYNLFHKMRTCMPKKDLIGPADETEERFKKVYMKTKYQQIFKEIC